MSEALMERKFEIKDSNFEITSIDIAPHGAFIAAGSSSGMVLLFDLSNPYKQSGGLLIGQIRARGMHTNLLMTVKFSEDSRFCFAGVMKGSSEMLAIDLGKVLVDVGSRVPTGQGLEMGSGRTQRQDATDDDACGVSVDSDPIQQQQLKHILTFSHSDAKLRGFGSVARMDSLPADAPTDCAVSAALVLPALGAEATYRLACGKGIKNVHIWHFSVDVATFEGKSALRGRWQYVYDVASNGNTITHIEFRQGGAELLSKSAGVNIRVWDLRRPADDAAIATSTSTATLPAIEEGAEEGGDEAFRADAAGTEDDEPRGLEAGAGTGAGVGAEGAAPLPPLPVVAIAAKPAYVDVVNSADVKCLLPYGSGAYGGTYQFAVLNTSAPREANRDALELPERYSGDVGTEKQQGIGRGRR